MVTSMTVTLADIQSARRTLRDVISATPILVDERLTQDLDARVFLKAENTQRSGSFKFRGAVLGVRNAERGVLAAGAGNFPIAVGLAAKALNKPACLIMPSDAPANRVRRSRSIRFNMECPCFVFRQVARSYPFWRSR